MPPRIHLLSEQTINTIAAGEVIAEPASVVKELVENALDAGASEIHVDIFSGGRSLIHVSDNGCGMGREDAERCFQRYATSKLSHVDDLFALHTMGFRGEALSSIAAISKCTLITATGDSNGMGTFVEIEGGLLRAVRSVPRSKGTTFEIRDLFYNVPVRRGFQKSPQSDVLAIHRVLIQLALSAPGLRFCLTSDQKKLFVCAGVNDLSPLEALRERIHAVLGEELGEKMRPIEAACDTCKVRGFLATPMHSKSSRTSQYLLLNARAVTSTPLAMAVKEGYGSALPQGRYPLFVLHLLLPVDTIDVNVHPQKKEVRLRHESQICRWLTAAVSEALFQQIQQAPFMLPAVSVPATLPSFVCADVRAETPSFLCAEEAVECRREDLAWMASPVLPLKEEQIPLPFPPPKLPPRVLSTLPGYLLLDSHSPHFAHEPLGLWLIDQRAAHRRLLHDQLVGSRQPHPQDSQMLMLPVVVALSPQQLQLFEASCELFARSGWQIESFGPSSVLIRAVPHASLGLSYETLFISLLDLSQEKELTTFDSTESSRFACALARRCVSMQTQLTREEATSLVEGLFHCKQPMFCPLGKPTLLYLPLAQISTLFTGASL